MRHPCDDAGDARRERGSVLQQISDSIFKQPLHVVIPGSLAQGRKRPGMTDMVLHSRGAVRPSFASPSRYLREGVERWEAPGCLRGTLGGGINGPTSPGK